MSKRMILKLGGTLEQGFQVTVQIWEQGKLYPSEKDGALSAAPELAECLNRWLHSYRQQAGITRLTVHKVIVHAANPLEVFRQQAEELEKQFQNWLKSGSFYEIELWLREKLNSKEPVQVLLRCEDRRLHHLPWHEWDFLNRYLQTDLAIVNALEPVDRSKVVGQSKVRILAILGDRTGIDINADQQLLHALPPEEVELTFLLEPSRQQINDQLWDQDWDVLFFAGHSSTEENQGRIYINSEDSLTIKELKYGLERSITRGLQLAIFNSCDGLGLAYELEPLHLPQLIVMREPVPDCVAQEFLKSFISAYAGGEPLYAAERIARQRLQPFEQRFPCATWLPIICQNLTEVPPTWQELAGQAEPEEDSYSAAQLAEVRSLESPPAWSNGLLGTSQALEAVIADSPTRDKPKKSRIRDWRRFTTVMMTSFVVTGCVMGVRSLGWLQSWELPAYDQMLRARPQEGPDPRLLVVAITDEDLQLPEQQQRNGSLSDLALKNLVQKLEAHQPRAIGLDIFRDFPIDAKYPELVAYLQNSRNFFAICHIGSSEKGGGISPPPDVSKAQQGFSNGLVDSDGVVRRQLLSMDAPAASPCNPTYSLNLQLALKYLEAEGITAKFVETWKLQIDRVLFQGLRLNPGVYPETDTWGTQIMLNYRSYRSPEAIADIVTLKQVLNNEVNSDSIKNRIVLIGAMHSTADYFYTPYSKTQSPDQRVAGVMLHAQMVSQILSAVEGKRPLIQFLPYWVNILWVWSWALLGGLLAWFLRHRLYLGLASGVVVGFVCVACYGLLIYGWWIPFVPAILGFTSVVLVVTAIVSTQKQ